jgi:uncharacterized iron-regulated membrane protein
MKKFNYKYLLRKAHRYLGLLIGVQFLFWTLGGLYFSWTNIEEIRGEHLRKKPEALKTDGVLVSPQIVIDKIKQTDAAAGITKIQLVEISGAPFYEIKFHSGDIHKTVTANALDGEIRQPITKEEAGKIAADALVHPLKIREISYLTKETVGGHHEFRSGALPAWAVTFDSSDDLTVYVAAENGQIASFRTNEWRIFDFLWMLHTMDYKERDNINNYMLRVFSVFGIVTILSGFLLFFASSPFLRKIIKAKARA